MKDEDFVSRTINEGSVDLDKFPVSKVCQLAKKLESSKATARHIRQVAGDPQAVQINLMHHQCTELPSGKNKKRKQGIKSRQSHHRNAENQASGQFKRNFDSKLVHKYKDRSPKCGDSAHLEGFQCPAKKFQCNACHKFGHSTSLCYQKNQQKQAPYMSRKPKAHQLKADALYVQDNSISGQSEDSSSDDSFCLQLKIQCTQTGVKNIPTPAHLIANLAYHLKSHHHRNLYLTARLDTCADVNIMPASVHRLMFKDPEMKKLAPSKLEIGTYTTDTVKIVGSHRFFLVNPDSKKLADVTFFIAINDGSALLSYKTTLALGPIQTRSRLDYMSPTASLITISVDHPKKTKLAKVSVHTSQKKVSTQSQTQEVSTQASMTTILKKQDINKLITSKEQILTHYPDVFEGTGMFSGPPYSIQLDQSIPPKQTPCQPVPVHLKESFKQEIDKMLKVGILRPVYEATPWINNFVLVEGKDKLGA